MWASSFHRAHLETSSSPGLQQLSYSMQILFSEPLDIRLFLISLDLILAFGTEVLMSLGLCSVSPSIRCDAKEEY